MKVRKVRNGYKCVKSGRTFKTKKKALAHARSMYRRKYRGKK